MKIILLTQPISKAHLGCDTDILIKISCDVTFFPVQANEDRIEASDNKLLTYFVRKSIFVVLLFKNDY